MYSINQASRIYTVDKTKEIQLYLNENNNRYMYDVPAYIGNNIMVTSKTVNRRELPIDRIELK